MTLRTGLLTLAALVAFAANSVLCRLALRGGTIDAASFAAVRLISGALVLLLVIAVRHRGAGATAGSWGSAWALFLYAVPFSFAYLSLAAGTGALVLFAAVQATMIGVGLRSGERPHLREWTGLAVALGGLVGLVAPGLDAPAPLGVVAMGTAGIAWGIYSLRGRGSAAPVRDTAGNFVRAAPLAVVVALATVLDATVEPAGVLLAVISGAVTSGLGYVVWYAALPGLTATRAATVQLAVPAIAAAGGAVVLGERITFRLLLASVLILGGVGYALSARDGPGRGSGTIRP